MAAVAELTALTVINLLLVLATGAADATAMCVLLLLAATAPWLRRLQHHALYQQAWRIAVLAVFAILIRDCARSGPAHMLEDGLLLAAVSQVHILMNLGARQPPDLLFLNSFVITLVTSYFAPGMSFCLMLVAYAACLVRALARQVAGPSPAAAAGQAPQELFLCGATILVTAALFLLLPRSFDREGLAWADLRLARAVRQVGFTPDVDLSRRGATAAASNRIVMLVRPAPGTDAPLPTYWRGATQRVFTGERWEESPLSHGISVDVPWRPQRDGQHWQRAAEGVGGSFLVEQRDLDAERLILPHGCVTVALDEDLLLTPGTDATLRLADPRRGRAALHLTVHLAAPGAEPRSAPQENARRLLLNRPRLLPPEVGTLAQTVQARAGRGASDRRVAETLAAVLAEDHRYMAPGEEGAAETLEEFLAPGGGGHCELFATVAALALRALDVPCRLATGYRATDSGSGQLVVRARDAHAWIEVLEREGGFWIFDPTPAQAVQGETASSWSTLWDKAQDAWGALLRFDDQGRSRGVAWLLTLPVRRPVTVAMVAAALVLIAWNQRARRRARVPAAVRAYLRRGGRQRLPSETPRELLARSRSDELAAATADHEGARYAHAAAGQEPGHDRARPPGS